MSNIRRRDYTASRSENAKADLIKVFETDIQTNPNLRNGIKDNCYNQTTIKAIPNVPQEYQKYSTLLRQAGLRGPSQFTTFFDKWYNQRFPNAPQNEDLDLESEEEVLENPHPTPEVQIQNQLQPLENIQQDLAKPQIQPINLMEKYKDKINIDPRFREPQIQPQIQPNVQIQNQPQNQPNVQIQQNAGPQVQNQPQLIPQNNNFINNQMAEQGDNIDQYFAQKIKKAAQPGIKSDKKYQPDPNAKYGQYGILEPTEEVNQWFNKPSNSWANEIRSKPKDYKYNIEMMDPEYVAWQAAKTGNIAYKGDFNNDGLDDIIYATPGGRILSYNGIKPLPSKQKIVSEYHNQYDPDEISNSGAPVYKTRPGLGDFYNTKSRNLKVNPDGYIIDNAEIGKGLKKWSYRDLTVSELLKEKYHFDKNGYLNFLVQITTQLNNDKRLPLNQVKNIASNLKQTTFRSLFTKAILLFVGGIFNVEQNLFTDDAVNKHVAEVNKNLNKKVKKNETFNPYAKVKESIVNIILGAINKYGSSVIQSYAFGEMEPIAVLYNLFTTIGQDENLLQQLSTINQTYNKIVAGNRGVADAYRQAHPQKQRQYLAPVMMQKQVPLLK